MDRMRPVIEHEANALSLKLPQPRLSHPKYRPDIDGLRAVAVLSVVGFHAFPDWVRGGFVGVDIFFVISGYLISTIIFQNLERESFRFTEFYARRVKRIFPALSVVLIATYAFGWYALLPDEFWQLGKHIVAGVGFVSNFILWKEAGYFDNSADTKPLLHLWSLGIEEQFYLIWPLLLWFAWKRKLNLLSIITVIALVSFYLNVSGVHQDVVASFYSPQTRFWELSCGSILAWLTLYQRDTFLRVRMRIDGWLATAIYREPQNLTGATLSNAASFAGLALLVYAFYRINEKVAFPGKWAVLPVLGAVLLISAGPKALPNRTILSSGVAVWFGLVSFPLYLWHWPLLAFARIIEGKAPSWYVNLSAAAIAVLLSWATYELVEKRVRAGKPSIIKVAGPVAVMAAIACVGFITYKKDGLLSRFNRLSPENRAQIKMIATAWHYRDYPRPEGAYRDPKYGFLRLGRTNGKELLILGDSHMQQYWNTLGRLYNTTKGELQEKPAILFAEAAFPAQISSQLLDDPDIRTVVFAYFWTYKYGSDKVDQALRCCGSGKNGTLGYYNLPLSSSGKMNEFDSQWLSIIKLLRAAGKDVYLLLDNPFGEEHDPHFMLSRSWRGFTFVPPPELSRETALARTEPVRTRLLAVAREGGAKIIDPMDYLCNDHDCPAFSPEGELMYKDYDHLSYFASTKDIHYLDVLLSGEQQ